MLLEFKISSVLSVTFKTMVPSSFSDVISTYCDNVTHLTGGVCVIICASVYHCEDCLVMPVCASTRPLWLSPRQVMLVPVNPSCEDYAKEVSPPLLPIPQLTTFKYNFINKSWHLDLCNSHHQSPNESFFSSSARCVSSIQMLVSWQMLT